MPEKIHKIYTELNAEVEFIAVQEQKMQVNIIARVVDTGSVGLSKGLVSEAVGLVYKQKHNIPDEQYNGAHTACAIPDPEQANAWYTHVTVSLRKP